MTNQLEWHHIVVRLALATFAGTLVGINRGEHGRPAGLRTTLLVCLAATVSMIQTHILLLTAGKRPDSFVSIDVMRLPLGILTGMGFIGGGAILKRGDAVVGVTTAATLWFVTVIGLRFGGGQNALGLAALALAMIVLGGLKRVEALLPQYHRAALQLTVASDGPTEAAVRYDLESRGYRVGTMGATYDRELGSSTIACEVHWRARSKDPAPPLGRELAQLPGITRVEWRPQGLPNGLD